MKNEVGTLYTEKSFGFRGSIIHQFAYLESVMSHIVVDTSFPNEETYNKYVEILIGNKDRLSINKKIELLKISIEKYERKHKKTLPNIIQQIKEFKSVRDIMAHGLLSGDADALKRFVEKDELTFYTIDGNHQIVYEIFTKKKTDKIIENIKASCTSLGEISNSIIAELKGKLAH